MNKIKFGFLFITISFIWQNQAQAYIDPGSGAFLLQILLGGVAGAMVVVKLYWHRIREWLFIRGSGKEKSLDTEDSRSEKGS